MSFNEELQKRTAEIEEILKKYLPEETGFQKTVLEAMNYSVTAGGKRLRPMLMQETYRMFGGSGQVIEPFMAAIEMIHTYSLVHDDLPAMDNDEYRRGRKTTHAVYGEALGILAGDALLNYAFETAAGALSQELNERTARAIQVLAEKAGIYGMIGGQVVDVESEGQAVSKEKLDFIYRLKTSALIESSMMIGALLAGASKEEVDKIRRTAQDVGLAFQIQDDILDVTSTLEVLGKPIHSDEKNEKTTYVTLEGLKQAKQDVEEISKRALATLASLGRENPFLEELITMLITREK
ncbi:MAG: polyprenyl synthetase family protein [Lachnospiraceae bacterium]|jgi:geranylgeranyl diphosphate synthase type II|nr:polyprenyl synthetase family protein [Lachnospiraceae bacterium]MCI9383812.1 polyprenyl synthetase family protein [Lachnospiraceae bacterium]MCI9622348.1 polyprenyl synthetase family protein [Lachnospiraceae bacterium]GFI08768.1 farnesyl diphosphate synthase [Lachnospiraceae bacterium]